MYEFNFSLCLQEISDPDYELTVTFVDGENWGQFCSPEVSEDSGTTFVKIKLIENEEGVTDIVVPIEKPANAVKVEVTVVAVDIDGKELGEPQPKKNTKSW